MGKYKLLELRTNTSDAARLDPKTTTTDDDDEQPVTKRDFKELQASIVWPPVYTRNQDLRRAEEMVQRRDEILLDNTLTSSEKIRRLSEVDRSFILFSKKAEDALGSNYTLAGGNRAIGMGGSVKPKSNPPPSSSSSASFRERPGPPMSVEDIIQSYTKLQKTKTQDVLQGIQRIGKLTWTEKGELYDVNSNSIMEGTDIQSLAKYHTLTNKSNKPVPKGYATYKNAVSAYQKQQAEQSPQREVASTSAIKDENRDVKPPTKKQKIEVDSDYSFDDDDDDDDDDAEGTLVAYDDTTDDDNDKPTPNLDWVFHPK